MDLLHACVGLVLVMVSGTRSCYLKDTCGCIVTDPTEIAKDDYVCDPIRTPDFQKFLNRLKDALSRHWIAYAFIYSLPDHVDPPGEPGEPLCPVERKPILGYFKNYGLTLCWVVKPHQQVVEQAECCSERCCGKNTRCEPGGYVLKKFLVYCDALYTDEDDCLIGTDELKETMPDEIHYKDDDSDGDKTYGKTRTRTRTRPPRIGANDCDDSHWYFAFKHEYLPSTCSCRRCDC